MEKGLKDALALMGGAVTYTNGALAIADPRVITSEALDGLVRQAVFAADHDERDWARWLIWELAQERGSGPASIHGLYMAMGEGKTGGFTVPAINIRILSYDTARAVFRAARARNAGAILCEIARSEMAYTDQRPGEYATVILAAALREGFPGPVFIQGDHFQVNHKKYAADPEAEVGAIRTLIEEALPAGFFNIDIDTSTLVDLAHDTLDAQQAVNYGRAAELTQFIRDREPAGVTVSVGGEIGEVGGKNSTVEELVAFMDGYNRSLAARGAYTGLSKISVQTGTSHGGVVLPDGSIAEVKLDLRALEALSLAARTRYRLAGAVQHGASTLPENAFGQFPTCGACEIHLATNFQSMVFDHPALPADLRERLRSWTFANCAGERGAKDSDEQFYYKSRKKAIGPHKRELWDLPASVRETIAADLEARFGFLFDQLKVSGTADAVARHVRPVAIRHAAPAKAAVAAPDDADAGE
ncbi:MAG: class II fructose-bisphosphate aldolase [Gemmatimonadales bacterium]